MQSVATAEPLFRLANDVRAFVESLERWQESGELVVAQRSEDLHKRVAEVRVVWGARADSVSASLDRLSQQMKGLASAPSIGSAIDDARAGLSDSYEQLVSALRAARGGAVSVHQVVSLRPRNYARNAFHVANGLVGAATYQWGVGRFGCTMIMLSILATYFSLELSRRIWPRFNDTLMEGWFRHIVRPRERYAMPSAIWYALGVLPVVLFASQTTTQVAVLVLGFGDPAASIIGKRFGRVHIFGRKSLEGSLAFVAASVAFVVPFLVFLRDLSWPMALAAGIAGAMAGALAEMMSDDRLDDNFTIPVAVALAVGFWVP